MTQWNASDAGTDMGSWSITGGGLTATFTANATNSGYDLIRASSGTGARNAGKLYAEFTVAQIDADFRWLIGLSNSTQSVQGYLGSSANSVGARPWDGSSAGSWFLNGSGSAEAQFQGSFTAGQVYGLAVDLGLNPIQVWLTKDGTHWNNLTTDSPATPSGGFAAVASPAEFYLGFACWPATASTGQLGCTLNPTGPFSYPIPSGYSAWDSPGALLAVTFPFASDAQSFTSTPGANSTMAWTGSLGNPAGDLQSSITGKSHSNANKWTLATTWAGLGIPAGAIVTGVIAGSCDSKCTTFTTGASSTAGNCTIVDGATTITLAGSRTFSATDASFVTTNGTDATGLALPASDSITLTINNTLATGNSSSAVVTLQQDNLNFTITYNILSCQGAILQMGAGCMMLDGLAARAGIGFWAALRMSRAIKSRHRITRRRLIHPWR